MIDEQIKITKRHLPHWTFQDSVYFITFRTKSTTLSINEQILVKDHIISGNNIFYTLYAAIVMPDHTHVILKPVENYTLERIMKGIKDVSAHNINLYRKTKGQIWQDESFDRIIRDKKEFDEKMNYMFNNPIKKNLTNDTWNYHGWYFNEYIE